VIHTTADFDYADNLVFSENAVDIFIEKLKNGVNIVTDTNMALAGINKRVLNRLGIKAYCFMADDDVAKEASERGITRAAVSVEKASKLEGETIFVVGNAPTSLIAIDRLVSEGKLSPSLIVGVPVGFVNVVESKKLIMEGNVPYIVSKGNKGGSTVAAAIVNAVLYKIGR
ncbi:MAG: precorrin-8X methylmutase, partial [Eubacteriales bacterium]|nr:precorrin-8X methylmutase [Eubacteriales bacterium]